jgi:hypothetical protein
MLPKKPRHRTEAVRAALPCTELSHHQEAVRCFQRSGGLYAGLGERYYHAETLTRPGDTCQASGSLPAGPRAWQQALTILADHSHADADPLRARLGRTGSATRAAAGTP